MPGRIVYEPAKAHKCTGRPWGWRKSLGTIWRCDECGQRWELFPAGWYKTDSDLPQSQAIKLHPAGTEPEIPPAFLRIEPEPLSEPPPPPPPDRPAGVVVRYPQRCIVIPDDA
ncbi:MAG: hypothetical protein E6R03_16740 [Hyphomicrobiaceae bacterium]|nr:MAG: hypothetical protein E6R03_16740 [Hyphomicrobiaceae bacterium]